MTEPIINPATLTEEQREAIKRSYNNAPQIIRDYEEIDKASTLCIVRDLFVTVFGKDFFNKGE